MNDKSSSETRLWKTLRSKCASPSELRAHFKEHQAPINVDKIARGLGMGLTQGKGDTAAARLVFTEQEASLRVSLDEAPDIQRIALASLLGHLMLDRPGEYTVPFLREGKRPDIKFMKYAKELLMPPALLGEALRDGLAEDQLATKFKVPPVLLDEWLSEIGLGSADRRKHERVPARVQVRFLASGQAAKALRAYSLNLSVGGLCIKTDRPYQVGDPVNLEMSVENENFQLVAQVSWVRGGAVGVRFTKLSEQDKRRLEALVASLRK